MGNSHLRCRLICQPLVTCRTLPDPTLRILPNQRSERNAECYMAAYLRRGLHPLIPQSSIKGQIFPNKFPLFLSITRTQITHRELDQQRIRPRTCHLFFTSLQLRYIQHAFPSYQMCEGRLHFLGREWLSILLYAYVLSHFYMYREPGLIYFWLIDK